MSNKCIIENYFIDAVFNICTTKYVIAVGDQNSTSILHSGYKYTLCILSIDDYQKVDKKILLKTNANLELNFMIREIAEDMTNDEVDIEVEKLLKLKVLL